MEKTNSELSACVCEALRKEVSCARIREVLLQTGWQAGRLDQALEERAEIEFSLPVPRPKPSRLGRETFFYILLFVTLYAGVFNFGRLLMTRHTLLTGSVPGSGGRYRH